jgi:hypothetical protein
VGFVANVKANQMGKDAAKARGAGRPVLVVKLNYPASKPDFSGEIVDWSAMIAAVEAEGWTLCQFAGMADPKGRPEALCMFRPR